MKTRHAFLAILGLVSAMSSSVASAQSIRFVRTNGPSNGDGQTWATAYDKVWKALDAAALDPAITQIWIAEGVHKPNRTPGNRDDTFTLVPNVTLYGGFAGDETELGQRDPIAHVTTLSGDLNSNDGAPGTFANIAENSRHVITAMNFTIAPAALDGLTVRGGNANFNPDLLLGGGALFIQSARVQLVNCTFIANSSGINQPSIGGFGGAVYNLGGELDAFDCKFTSNRGDSGGSFGMRDFNDSTLHAAFHNCQFVSNTAMHQSGGAVWTGSNPFDTVERDLIFENCLFENNKAQYGGAITDQNTKHVRLIDCTFRNNESFVVAGAVWHSQTGGPDQEPIQITRCLFIDNTTSDGGGAFFGTATGQVITNCVFINKSATEGLGGAIRSGPQFGTNFGVGPLTLTNCVFSGNSAVTAGAVGALRNPTAKVINCTFAGNTANSGSGGLFSDAFNLTVDNTIFWQNTLNGAASQAGQLQHSPSFGPLSIDHSCVQGLTGSLGGVGNIGLDPLFIDANGADNIVGTIDDDLHVDAKSPTIDAGDATALAADVPDLDGDLNVVEPTPLDLENELRVSGRAVDMGAFEHGGIVVEGDITGDGLVDVDDLLAVINAWGKCPSPCAADLTGDGMVDVDDLLMVINNWS